MPVRVRLWARILRGTLRFLLRGIGVAVILWVLLLLGIHWLLSTEMGQSFLRKKLILLLSEALDTDVELSALRLSGLSHISLEGLVIYDKNCERFAEVKEVRIGWYPSALWRGIWKGSWHIPFSEISLRQPSVYIYTEKATGLTNVDRLFGGGDTTSTKGQQSWRVSLSQLRLEAGRFRWIDSTAESARLQPQPGFIRYENLYLDSLYLTGGIEWLSQGYLFAEVEALSLYERHARFSVPQVELVLQGYQDSVVIPHLYLRLPHSEIIGQGRFPNEGLEKLFSDTETKQFIAALRGTIDWDDISVLAGDSLPLKGSWHIDLQASGDLYRMVAEQFDITLSPEAHLRGKGSVTHYARPSMLHWEVHLSEARLPLGTLESMLPGVIELPAAIRKDVVWNLKGSHTGRLHHYTTTVEGEGFHAHLLMEKLSSWRYGLTLRMETWPVANLWASAPLRTVSGSLTLSGEGFTLPALTAHVEGELSGWDTLSQIWRLRTKADVAQAAIRGYFLTQTPYGLVEYQGSLPLSPAGTYEGKGKVVHLSAQLWGSAGTISADFSLKGEGLPWRGSADVALTSLVWIRSDSTYSLGQVHLQSTSSGHYTLTAEGLEADLQGKGEWMPLLSQWVAHWIRGDSLPGDTLPSPWSVQGFLHLSQPVWLPLLGLPPQMTLSGATLRFQLGAEHTFPQGTLSFRADSIAWQGLTFRHPYLNLTLRGDSLGGEIGSASGSAYLSYEAFHLWGKGTWWAGYLHIEGTFSGQRDSMTLQLSWSRTPDSFFVYVEKDPSFLALSGQRWSFTEAHPIQIHLSTGQFITEGLRLETDQSHLMLRWTPTLASLSIARLPLMTALGLAGYSLPLSGYLSFEWEKAAEAPAISLLIDSVLYEGQAYPTLRLEGQPEHDSLTFNLLAYRNEETFLRGRGVYRLADTTTPLYAELRGLRLPAQWLRPFIADYVENLRGSFVSERLLIQGQLQNPRFYGQLLCNQVSFYLPLTRVVYTIDGVLRLREDTIFFPSVELRESRNRRGYIDGYITLGRWESPQLQLTTKVRDRSFLLAAASPTTDAYLYGTAELDQGSLSITGPWHSPVIQGEVFFSNNTDLSLPLRTYERSSGAEHVRFVQASQPELKTEWIGPTGVDVEIVIRSAPETRFKLLFDERTGDEISAQGTANLLLTIRRDGTVRLAGSYEVHSGEYRVNLQGIAAKKLLLEPGSRIIWDGDLYTGQMEITATYRTLTSLRMIDTSFTQTLPVELRVFLRGTLLSPMMSFQVDIPSLSGSPTPMVNLFLQRLATDEQERNRQVFALLVLGTFVPLEQGMGAQQVSSGVSTTLAEFISAQLTSWVGQTLGNQIGVAFALGEWNELSARLRLSIGQRLTIERDGVLVGPGQTNAALGNLSARYRLLPRRLTQSTQWQLEVEGFSRQSFMWGVAGGTSQGAGMRLRKSFYPPERRRKPTDKRAF